MTSAEAALQIIGRTLWDPNPTVTDESQQQLAIALGYPESWRVVRTIESLPFDNTNKDDEQKESEEVADQKNSVDNPKVESGASNVVEDNVVEDNVVEDNVVEDKDAKMADDDESTKDKQKRKVIVDRIYAGKPPSPDDNLHIRSVDVWFNHYDAQQAALELLSKNEDGQGAGKGYEYKGGHLLPRKPKFAKGDEVQVLYHDDDEWYDATVTSRKEYKDGFKYTIYYPVDDSTQTKVLECDIRKPIIIEHPEPDPYEVAIEQGFPVNSEWQAIKNKKTKKWKFIAPNGKTFTTKKSALAFANSSKKRTAANKKTTASKKRSASGSSSSPGGVLEEIEDPPQTTTKVATETSKQSIYEQQLSEGDPPWRTSGHEFIGRKISWKTVIQKSATRKINVEQQGTIRGWISQDDVDSAGEPAFISDRTDQPADLFFVIFDEEPNHPYSPSLLATQDLEEDEIIDSLIPLETEQNGGGGGTEARKTQKQTNKPTKKRRKS